MRFLTWELSVICTTHSFWERHDRHRQHTQTYTQHNTNIKKTYKWDSRMSLQSVVVTRAKQIKKGLQSKTTKKYKEMIPKKKHTKNRTTLWTVCYCEDAHHACYGHATTVVRLYGHAYQLERKLHGGRRGEARRGGRGEGEMAKSKRETERDKIEHLGNTEANLFKA